MFAKRHDAAPDRPQYTPEQLGSAFTVILGPFASRRSPSVIINTPDGAHMRGRHHIGHHNPQFLFALSFLAPPAAILTRLGN